MGLLSVAIWLPVAIGAVLLAVGRDEHAGVVRWVALLGAVASFLVTLPLIGSFDTASAAMQFQENLPWIERFNVRYHLGVDGISVWFVLLTAFFVGNAVVAEFVAELRAYAPKLRPGGIMAGHDYSMGNWVKGFRYGVIEAVHEFCVEHDWELRYLTVQRLERPSFAISHLQRA